LLPWKHACLRSHYLGTAVEYLLLSWPLPRNRSACHNIIIIFSFITANI
jgi:hypothetical protein